MSRRFDEVKTLVSGFLLLDSLQRADLWPVARCHRPLRHVRKGRKAGEGLKKYRRRKELG